MDCAGSSNRVRPVHKRAISRARRKTNERRRINHHYGSAIQAFTSEAREDARENGAVYGNGMELLYQCVPGGAHHHRRRLERGRPYRRSTLSSRSGCPNCNPRCLLPQRLPRPQRRRVRSPTRSSRLRLWSRRQERLRRVAWGARIRSSAPRTRRHHRLFPRRE